MKMFVVGGWVRDRVLGVPSKDVDFSVVFDGTEDSGQGNVPPFDIMVNELKRQGFKIFLETPEHLTVRAQFPKGKSYNDHGINFGVRDADFVLARKEGTYSDGRRPDSVEVGTLHDDLARRDFTMNAIAMNADGSYIDPFNGQEDLAAGLIRAVGDPIVRLTEDALRAVRAVRFAVTKNMAIDVALSRAIEDFNVLEALEKNIADERISEEIGKMFRFDTVMAIETLSEYPRLTESIFSGRVSLDSTLKQKGRGR